MWNMAKDADLRLVFRLDCFGSSELPIRRDCACWSLSRPLHRPVTEESQKISTLERVTVSSLVLQKPKDLHPVVEGIGDKNSVGTVDKDAHRQPELTYSPTLMPEIE